MEQEKVKDHFKKQVADYVGFMTRIIPGYLELQRVLCESIPFSHSQNIRVLDLGAGPCLLSEVVLKTFPNANVVAFDLTEEMLEKGKQNIAIYNDRFSAIQGDYKKDSFGVGYDVILAGLTLHHLNDAERQHIFSKFYKALNPNGVFIAGEVIVDEDPYITERHYSLWRFYMKRNGEDDAFWYQKHQEKDHPVSIEKEQSWLKSAGFSHIACHWRYWNFAVISGQKIVSAGA